MVVDDPKSVASPRVADMPNLASPELVDLESGSPFLVRTPPYVAPPKLADLDPK